MIFKPGAAIPFGQVAREGWAHIASSTGGFSHEQIQTACAQATVAGLDRTVELLANLLQRLDSLGVDGIHTVIKEHARVIRKRDRQRLARARARRRAKREAVAR